MSDDFGRRRRLNTQGPRRSRGGGNNNGWFITIGAAIVVVIGGWFLGMALAHLMNSPKETTAQRTPAPLATPAPSPSVASTAAPSPSASPPASPTPKATLQPTATPVPRKPLVIATPARTPAPVATATATPEPAPSPTPVPTAVSRRTLPVARRPEVSATPASPASTASENPGAQVVRSYIAALKRGDPQSAAQFLGNGSPDESFIGPDTRITSLSSNRNSDGSYKVEVDMTTAGVEYYETFVVASTPAGTRILDKTSIKP